MTTPNSKKSTKNVLKTPQELVHIKHNISLIQYKYWILFVRVCKDTYVKEGPPTEPRRYQMNRTELSEAIGYDLKAEDILVDLNVLLKTLISINLLKKNGKNPEAQEAWESYQGFFASVERKDNLFIVEFPQIIEDAIANMENPDSMFTLLNWAVFNSFSGKYEAVLYKLCKDYMGVGRTPYLTLRHFREYMGIADTEYTEFKRLNQWVISSSVKKINSNKASEIKVKEEFKREARKIVGLWFFITQVKLPKAEVVTTHTPKLEPDAQEAWKNFLALAEAERLNIIHEITEGSKFFQESFAEHGYEASWVKDVVVAFVERNK